LYRGLVVGAASTRSGRRWVANPRGPSASPGTEESCLRVLQVAIFARENRRVPSPALRGQTLDQRVVVGMAEERDRKARGTRAGGGRRIHDAVHVREPPIVGPAHEQIADVHDEGRG